MAESYELDRIEQVFDAKMGQMEHRFDSLNRELSNSKEQTERSLSHLEEKINLKLDLIRQSVSDIEKRSESAKKDKELTIQAWMVYVAIGALILNMIVDFFGLKLENFTKEPTAKEKQK